MPGSGGGAAGVSSGGNSGGIGNGGGGVSTGGGGGVGSGGSGGVGSGPAVWLAENAPVVPDPAMRRADLPGLHPRMRAAALELLRRSDEEGLQFRLFEAFRGPFRQNWLYQQGRSLPNSKIVTNAPAWSSYHQYGLAADFVLFIHNKWSWETAGALKRRWKRLHELGAEVGLEPLSFEMPHLQLAGLSIAKLRGGKFPPGGDDGWRDNLEAAVISWNGIPAAPPVDGLRPALP